MNPFNRYRYYREFFETLWLLQYVRICTQGYYCLQSISFLQFHWITREMFLSVLSSRRTTACHYIRDLVAQYIKR